jgi:hypothetical protein
MAFQFVPPFEEGDKQTNPETKVEYIFTDGAWRPLGPSIEDEFDTLDDRYIKLQGTTDLSNYYRLRGPNTAGTGTSTFQVIDEGQQKLYNIKTPTSSDTGWVANVQYVNNEIAALNSASVEYVDNAIEALDSASIEYVNDTVSDYLPLTGGDLTGDILINDAVLNIDRPSGRAVAIKKDGVANLQFWADGAATTTKTTFANDNFVTKLYVDTKVDSVNTPDVDLSGYLEKTGGTMTGELKIDRGSSYNHLLLKTGGTNQLKLGSYNADETRLTVYNGKTFKVVGYVNDTLTQLIGISNTGRLTLGNVRTPTADRDAATKAYVDTRTPYPGLRFKFKNATSVTTGTFAYYQDGGLRLKISNTSQDYKWNDGGITHDYSFSEGHRFSIYEKLSDGSLKIIRTGTYNRADYHANDVLLRVSSHQTNGSFNTSSEYYLSVSGLF